MNKNGTVLLLAIAGMAVGIGLVEYWWRFTHDHLYRWMPPHRGVDYFLMTTICSMSMGALGAALAGFRAESIVENHCLSRHDNQTFSIFSTSPRQS